MLRLYPSSSTQQPAAQCILRSPADAIHILESVRLGLIPRVTRRLTGHERAMIRPGTVWVWEEEETNMRRWTDGRRWGASRVGGGGFLVYREVEGGGGRHDSTSASPPPSSRNSPSRASNDSPPRSGRKAGLVKQTYSTSMAHPVTGRVKKFHVVAYSCKSDPGHLSLPLPHQLPHLAYVKIMPGVWPDWEQRQDENSNGPKAKAQLQVLGGAGARSSSATPLPSPLHPAPVRAQYSSGSIPNGARGPPSRGQPEPHHSNGHSPVSRSGTPQYAYYSNGSGPSPVSNGRRTPPLADKERFHPYRSTPRPVGFPSSLSSSVPSPASSGHLVTPVGSATGPPPGMYERDSAHPTFERHWPPVVNPGLPAYPESHRDEHSSRSLFPARPPMSSYYDRERERERGRDEPVVSINSPPPEEAPIRSSYSAPFASHPSISAARDSHSRPGSPALPPPGDSYPRARIGIAGIMNDLPSHGDRPGSSGITLPPLRLALDSSSAPPRSPGRDDAQASQGRKWGEDQRQLNQLGRMVGF